MSDPHNPRSWNWACSPEALTQEQIDAARNDPEFQQRIAAAQDRFRPLLERLKEAE